MKRFKSARETNEELRKNESGEKPRCFTCSEEISPDNKDKKRRMIFRRSGYILCERCRDFQDDGVEKLGRALGI